MANIVRWDPFSELQQMRETMDRLFEDFRPIRWPGVANALQGYGAVPVDVRETADAIEVSASLPGVKAEDVDIQVHGETVTIKGEMKEEREEKEGEWLRRERRYGAFARSLTLPTEIDADRAQASFENGVLKLHLPKSEQARPKTIKVTNTVEGSAA